MTVTLISLTDPCARIVFTWNDACTDCDFTALGDHDIDAIVAAKGHEGADVAGYTIEVA